MSTDRLAGAGLAAAIALAGTFAAPPAARAAAAAAPTGTYLVLTVRPAARGHARSTVLRCDPPRGSHPAAVRACGALAAVDGRPAALKPAAGVLCTMEYAPATASARGRWHGRPVAYRHTFANRCLLGVHTGIVFRF